MTRPAPRTRARRLVLVIFVVLVAIAAPLIWRATATPRGNAAAPVVIAAGPSAVRARRETRPTLDPKRFVGKAALGHQVAREIPDVLDQLYCYCECDKTSGHKSLLSCFTDGHAAT